MEKEEELRLFQGRSPRLRAELPGKNSHMVDWVPRFFPQNSRYEG